MLVCSQHGNTETMCYKHPSHSILNNLLRKLNQKAQKVDSIKSRTIVTTEGGSESVSIIQTYKVYSN